MCVFLISPVPITEPLTSELIDTPVFYNLAPRPIKYRDSVPIPTFNRYDDIATTRGEHSVSTMCSKLRGTVDVCHLISTPGRLVGVCFS